MAVVKTEKPIQLALGPILYFWDRAVILDFYEQIARTPVDIVYLGETVCAKRRQLSLGDWLDLGYKLKSRGKQVILSTLTLLEAESELSQLRKICQNGDFLVEANDMSAVQILSEQGVPFVSGPFINIYNAHTLQTLVNRGLQRWVMPVELSRQTLDQILAQAKQMGLSEQFETEVFSYGKLPLAYSARCFTARAYNIPKDSCEFICSRHPDGLPMQSQEGEAVFTINGIQTQSGETYNLLAQLPAMRRMGVDVVRLSPQSQGMEAIIEQFDQARLHGVDQLESKDDGCNGYWFQRAGMENCYTKSPEGFTR